MELSYKKYIQSTFVVSGCMLFTLSIGHKKCNSVYVKNSIKKKWSFAHKKEDYRETDVSSQTMQWKKDAQKFSKKRLSVLSKPNKKNYILKMRILLDEKVLSKPVFWKFVSKNGFLIHSSNHIKKKQLCHDSSIEVSTVHGMLRFNNKPVTCSVLHIKPINNDTLFKNHRYQGSFVIACCKNKVLCINVLDIEKYIFSVLRTESWPGWPIEVNKVFAIVSRSYAVFLAMKARKNNQWFDVKNTNEHQTYNGIHQSKTIKYAVDKTKGVILGFEHKPVLAMFDSCCGGIIPAHIEDVDFTMAPYLARTYACTHCKRCKIYAWKIMYDYDFFERAFLQNMPKNKTIKSIKITKKDKAGLVKEVICNGSSTSVMFSGKKIYSLLREVKSFCFNVRRKKKKLFLRE